MKRRLSKILCVALSLLFIFGSVGCNENNNENQGQLTYNEFGEYTGGLHSFNKTLTSDYIYKDGRVNYTLVLPDEVSSRSTLARNDFQMIFLKATGKNITAVQESSVSWDETQKFIVIGSKKLEEQANLTLSTSVNANGYQIKTVGKSIFIMAQDETGALFGTYELLTQLLNYERYSVGHYVVDENVTEVPLYNFDITDNPDFERRIGPWGAVYSDNTNASRMRFLLQYQDVYIHSDEYPAFHNTLDALSPERYMTDYPEWYAQQITDVTQETELAKVKQLCYTAHGNEEKYQKMVATMAEVVIEQIQKDTVRNIITITQEDNTSYCMCEKCVYNQNRYGVLSGSMFVFQNDVARIVGDWVDENQPGRQLLLAMFAYQTYQQAPAYKDENGEWHPVDSSVVGEDNVAIFFAPSTANYLHSFNQDANSSVMSAIEGWQVCAKHFGTWMYQTTYDNYFLPFDNFGSMQDNYKAVLGMGSKWIFDQGQQGNKNLTGFNNFKLYLNSKLQWNVNLDYNTLFNNYFDGMFGPASQIMKNFFFSLRYLMNGLSIEDIEASLDSAANFPESTVREWISYCESAWEAIESVKATNPELYEIYYENICAESIMPRYMLINYYPGSISPEQLKLEKASFKEDCLRINFSESKQHTDITEMLANY